LEKRSKKLFIDEVFLLLFVHKKKTFGLGLGE